MPATAYSTAAVNWKGPEPKPLDFENAEAALKAMREDARLVTRRFRGNACDIVSPSDKPTRKSSFFTRIMDYVRDNPGATRKEITDALGASEGMVGKIVRDYPEFFTQTGKGGNQPFRVYLASKEVEGVNHSQQTKGKHD